MFWGGTQVRFVTAPNTQNLLIILDGYVSVGCTLHDTCLLVKSQTALARGGIKRRQGKL